MKVNRRPLAVRKSRILEDFVPVLCILNYFLIHGFAQMEQWGMAEDPVCELNHSEIEMNVGSLGKSSSGRNLRS